MIVLIVDDQTNVVNGIVAGVRWHMLGVQKVLKAYNAYEAKELIRRQTIDLMLCDIEMPAEDGLSLLRWVRENAYKIECIFLTAHADFQYTTEAIRLGGFDYILQPARYEDIEKAMLKAFAKLEKKNELLQLSSYGQLLYHRKSRIFDSILQDWVWEREPSLDKVLKDLAGVDVYLRPEGRIYPVLFRVAGFEDGVQEWENTLIRFSLENILLELFDHYGQRILFFELDYMRYCLLVYENDGYLLDKKGIIRQVRKLTDFSLQQLGMKLSCYMGEECVTVKAVEALSGLCKMDRDNIGNAGGILFQGQESFYQEKELPFDLKRWGGLLEKGSVCRVREESIECLRRFSEEGRMNARQLRRFYYEYWQIVCNAMNTLGILAKDMFADEQILEESVTWTATIKGMERFIEFTTTYLERQIGGNYDDKSVVDEIKEYIHNNLEKEIRRSEIAEKLFFSQDYLSRIFKKETGISLKEYIIKAKMEEARLLLQSTPLAVSMIATKVGYTNFSHFSQIYKKEYGVTPTEEREGIRQQ